MTELILSYGYVIVFFGSILEGDATVLAASFLAHRHLMSFLGVLATAGVATTLWNELVFYFSRKNGKTFLDRRVARHPGYDRVQRWVQRRSVLLLLFSRYIFGFRLAIPVACGATGMRAARFTVVNAAGAALWVIPVGCVGFFLGNVFERFGRGMRQWEWHIACALLVLLTAFLAWKDPELRRVSLALTHIRRFTVLSTHRIRHRFGGMPRIGIEERLPESVCSIGEDREPDTTGISRSTPGRPSARSISR
jgi:membrane protein DedA with SNARE-associated domain